MSIVCLTLYICVCVLVTFGPMTVLHCAVPPDAGGVGHGLYLSGSGERGETSLFSSPRFCGIIVPCVKGSMFMYFGKTLP